jgi:hypothetical protein
MWIRNLDTGKWSLTTDQLPKADYEKLKQDFESVKLFSKCLSGSVYIMIDNFDNIYNTFDIQKMGYYISSPYANLNIPSSGKNLMLNSSNYEEFYKKYLKENAFTIKNLFTPSKLINDEDRNLTIVDVASTEHINNLLGFNQFLTIDGVRIIQGHRVLIKDQKTKITLQSSIDAKDYFTNVIPVSNFEIVSDNGTDITYQYLNKDNGVYKYTDNVLVRERDFENYDLSYKANVTVKYGNQNADKQFHLNRTLKAYFPISGENMEFVEKHNWILRHRFDYNNVLELNFYDVLSCPPTTVYSRDDNFTYSIPERLISVGEFGVILNNQDKLNPTNSYRTSNIINCKYKVNFRSISQTNEYYWICGDEGTFLKVFKPTFTIEKIDLNIFTNLRHVNFLDNLNGFLVGDFNKIFFTVNGGKDWEPLIYPEYESYSFKRVVFRDTNTVYICGTTGFFVELTRSGSSWTAYKRRISKLVDDEEYVLVDDIYDLLPVSWKTFTKSTFIEDPDSKDFSKNLEFNFQISKQSYDVLQIDISTKETSQKFLQSQTYIGFSIYNGTEEVFRDNVFNLNPIDFANTSDFSIFITPTVSKEIKYINLDSIGGSIKDYDLSIDIIVGYNYDAPNDSLYSQILVSNFTYSLKSETTDLVVMSSDDKLVVYDNRQILTNSGDEFIYMEFDKKVGDVRTISKSETDDKIYLGADKLYYLNLGKITDIVVVGENYVESQLFDGPDLYANRIKVFDKVYILGNDSLLEYIEFTDFNTSNSTNTWDPDFNSRYKSRLLFLDYDISSKLNFFTDGGQYRMPNSITVKETDIPNGGYLSFTSKANEKSWIDYYRDYEKTFAYYTDISDTNKVEFSCTFSNVSFSHNFFITGTDISATFSDIKYFAPSLEDSTSSDYFSGTTPILASTLQFSPQPNTLSNFNVLIYKNLIIFKRNYNDLTEVGDVIRIESDVIDCNLIVNRVVNYYKTSGGAFFAGQRPTQLAQNSTFEKYIYCFNTFNQNIVNNLKNYTGQVKIMNLNRFDSISDLGLKLNLHPINIAYESVLKFDSNLNTDIITITPKYNNKTAYYNLGVEVVTPTTSYEMSYTEAFLIFGFSPTYNILDVLNKIDGNVFVESKKFTILPEYFNFDGCTFSNFGPTKVCVSSDSNKIYFGESLKFEWESLLQWTFVDFDCSNNNSQSITTERLLIISKEYNESIGGYEIQFHKKYKLPDLQFGINKVNVHSRNTLGQISKDLQLLNNIQRAISEKSVLPGYVFTQFYNDVNFKFPTSAYLKVLVSDFEIDQKVSGIVYTDERYQLAFNIINVEREILYEFNSIYSNPSALFNNKVTFVLNDPPQGDLKVGDLIFIELTGGDQSSETLNPQYAGFQTIVDVTAQFITTSVDYGIPTNSTDTGFLRFIKKDPFLNYEPIDLFDISSDKKPKMSIEITPNMVLLQDRTFSLVNVDVNKYKLKFVDGLFLQEIEDKYSWFLQGETSNAVIGKNSDGLVWYRGTWRCGRWFSGTWLSGDWLSGDWYGGKWYSSTVKVDVLSAEVSPINTGDSNSKWYGGRWFGGDWYAGTWYDGRRYGGTWAGGIWFNGIWNDGDWSGGRFQGGIWVYGNWYGGKFNCDSRLSYWLDGKFIGGDFENGLWYNGQFGNDQNILARFGTRSINTRISQWEGGKWISGEFHSALNTDEMTGETLVSDVHTLSVWKTGLWLGGEFWGGIAYNIDFRGGIWKGGILEEVQVSGLSQIYDLSNGVVIPKKDTENKIYLNGIFRFNPGDEVYIIDDFRGTTFSTLGSNDKVGKYRVNKIYLDYTSNQTELFLNYNLTSLDPKIDDSVGLQNWSNIETGLRVVSHFVEGNWESGYWTNGYFESGTFLSGIWFNGVFEGNWGK